MRQHAIFMDSKILSVYMYFFAVLLSLTVCVYVKLIEVVPYYLANTPPFATTPPNSFDENYSAGIIISED